MTKAVLGIRCMGASVYRAARPAWRRGGGPGSNMPVMSEGSSELLAPLVRGAEHVIQAGELAERLERGRPLRVKLGVDPTARDVTLGWAVPLRKLRAFQDAGHTAVLIVGDFTARIGDPTGKSEVRRQLSVDEVKQNAQTYLD